MKKALFIIIILAISFYFTKEYFNQDHSLSDIQKNKTIRIGYSIEPPFAYVTPNGDVTGLSTTVAKEIAKRLKIVNIEWRLIEFGSLINELESDKIDLIATGMYINKERAKRINFSEPTFHVKQSLVVAKGNPKKLHSYQQAFEIENVKIAVLEGAVEGKILKEIGFSPDQIIEVPDVASGKIVVEAEMADGFALSEPSLKWLVDHQEMETLEIADPFVESEITQKYYLGYGAVQFQKKDKTLQSAWNNELEKFIGSPKHLEILAEFGFTSNELPGEIKTSEILN